MAFPDAFSPQRLFIRIELQDDLRDLSPIGAVALGVQEAWIANARHFASTEEGGQDRSFLICPNACDVTLRKSQSSRDDPQLGRIFSVRANLGCSCGQIEAQGSDAATVA